MTVDILLKRGFQLGENKILLSFLVLLPIVNSVVAYKKSQIIDF
jgi:hypothetical protein